ncbi:MAG: PLDc N-terminal domain-containing protein [Myxococcota bacterium]|jgi:hypothetical protein
MSGIWDIGSFLGIAGTVIWIFALIDCIRNEPDRYTWLLIILFLNVIGALIYFAVRRLPAVNYLKLPVVGRWIGGLTRHRELWQAEADATNIGNPYHFVVLGDLLLETGNSEKAGAAYKRAIEKEPTNIRALYGASLIDEERGNYQEAKDQLGKVLAMDESFDYGGASLAYAKVLYSLGDAGQARTRLEKHLVRWNHPEAGLILARIYIDQGLKSEAKVRLEAVINTVKGAPQYFYRKNRRWVGKARRMLWKL